MNEELNSARIRTKIFEWLEQKALPNDSVLYWKDLTQGFIYEGKPIHLIGAQGIWKPKEIKYYPISITSVENSQYDDGFRDDDSIFYSYRGTDPNLYVNVSLREAMKNQIPLIYLHQLKKGKYFVTWPVFIIGDQPDKLRFIVSAESKKINLVSDTSSSQFGYDKTIERSYKTREVIYRLHQKSFRERVLAAYRDQCAVCSLKHRNLLDAAHIIPDSDGGSVDIANGLSLCKIHHAAYDQNIIGISPDYFVDIRKDILEEIDGPMLKHGLQEMRNRKILIPKKLENQPNQEWLELRYKKFKAA